MTAPNDMANTVESNAVTLDSVRLVGSEYCFGCSQKRPCKQTGTYRYDGKYWPIWVCQWCRAAATKKMKKANETETGN